MRLASFRGPGGEPRTGAVVRDRVIDLTDFVATLGVPADHAAALASRGLAAPPGGMLRLLYAGPQAMRQVAAHVEALSRDDAGRPLAETALLAPIPRPGKVVAIGRNYADHAKETGVDPFEKPRIIAKLPSSVVGPGTVVRRPAPVTKLDFEAELAVIIGAFASSVPQARALEVVAGYTALDDVSAREFQFDVSPPQTTFAKSMDAFCPMGPWLVTRDEIPDPQTLEVACFVNGEAMQRGHTKDMIFPVDRLIAYITQYMTLEPGDVIATGTPAGVGAFREPPVWLKPGDRVRIEVSRIGALEHTIG
ncbi:MAG TPA: fumarylacetoacetate hydrolase family protein [Burkholderiales bacterium]|nr:fumarylacetoacetate hydrolase family protein [Burkholderiales bacterium]